MAHRRTAGQKALGPTLAANVRPMDVLTLAQHRNAIWEGAKQELCDKITVYNNYRFLRYSLTLFEYGEIKHE